MQTSVHVKPGDIVFVRINYPHKWHPALVLSSNHLGVKLTFSLNDTVSSTYFPQSEVLPFEQAFSSLISHNPHAPLLHSALRFLGHTLISALRCPCLTGRHNQSAQCPNGSGSFDPAGVLGFVLDAAVSPWVEPPRFAHAVRVVAQVHAFRSYYSTYQETQRTGDNVKLLPSSSLGQKMYSVSQESVVLEPKEICQAISKNKEKNMAFGAIRTLNYAVLVSEGSSKPLFKNKLLLISENLMHSPSLDSLSMVRESLKSERQSLLGFKSISDQGIVDIYFGNSSTMSETRISVPSNFKIHLSNYINALGLCSRLPDAETSIYLSRKRRRLGKPESVYVFPQICGVQESKRDAYISNHTTPRILDIKLLEPEGNIQKDHQTSTCFRETTMKFTDEVQKVDLRKSQNCQSLSNLVLCFHSDKCVADASGDKVKGMLESDSYVYQERLRMICDSDTDKLKKSARTELSSVQKVDSKRFPNCKSLSNLELHFHSDKFAVDARAVKAKDMLGSDSSLYQERLQMSCNSNITPLKAKRSARIALSSGNCLVEGKDCYEGAASCSIFNSKVGQPSKSHVPFSPKSLYMKFPKNFKLPSKEQLIKKFHIFGSVDSSKTRVFCLAGSAQVAFLKEIDAVAAYQYAKRKAWFGEANVRFWLDPFEHKRRRFKCFRHVPASARKQIGTPPSASEQIGTPPLASEQIGTPPLASEQIGTPPLASEQIGTPPLASKQIGTPPSGRKQIGTPLKSCLKNSNSWRQENRKQHCRVRHLAPSASKQIGPPLKSCLKNSNSLKQENRKKHRRVRFTIET